LLDNIFPIMPASLKAILQYWLMGYRKQEISKKLGISLNAKEKEFNG
jgi:hypothetical protein